MTFPQPGPTGSTFGDNTDKQTSDGHPDRSFSTITPRNLTSAISWRSEGVAGNCYSTSSHCPISVVQTEMPATSNRAKAKKCQQASVSLDKGGKEIMLTCHEGAYDAEEWKSSVRDLNLVLDVLARSNLVVFQRRIPVSRFRSGMFFSSIEWYFTN